ncbi:recombinase family protein [Labedaea rhizosphaerae]|uniref:recombinase family protein n=1 Tax=Labedaea rhizosphaerae TaxID=598644 RepID=UPI0010610BCA|nr:recombinase family protein [Labedaea rhizosphaerae]
MPNESIHLPQAALYLRDGSARQSAWTAVEQQRDDCQRIAEGYGLQVVREYLDFGRPARREHQHELRRLLDDLARRLQDITYVVVWDYARLAADMLQLEEVTDSIRAAGAHVVTMTGVEAAGRFINYQERMSNHQTSDREGINHD